MRLLGRQDHGRFIGLLARGRQDGKREATKTPNGENPLVKGGWPLPGCDVCEHSHYLDYKNERPKYLEAWFDHLINWEHVEELLAQAPGS